MEIAKDRIDVRSKIQLMKGIGHRRVTERSDQLERLERTNFKIPPSSTLELTL
jgi:hypothetical protein